MNITIPMLPSFRPQYDIEGKLLISDVEYRNIRNTLSDRGFMHCMMGLISHDVDNRVWRVQMATN